MAFIGGAVTRVTPSYVMPEALMQYGQVSGAFELLAGGDPLVRLADGDLFVYLPKITGRSKVAAGQSAYNELPSAEIVATQLQTATYLVRTRAQWDHHDVSAAQNWGIALPEAYRLLSRQGIFQQARNAELYGFQPANGEGLLNSVGSTTISLPADTNGHSTVMTYDPGQMAVFLLQQLVNLKARTLQLGRPNKVVAVGPMRTMGQFQYPDIVELAQFQSPGGGTTSTAGVLMNVAEHNGDSVLWLYDDTLIGKGAGGTDAVILCIPEVAPPNGRGTFNTNEFAGLQPGLLANTLMLTDMAAPREIPTPIAGGAVDVLFEQRITSGWAPRPEAITIISMQYQ